MLPYIRIYSDFIDIVRELDNGARGHLFLAVMQYANDEEVTNLTGAVKIAFLTIKNQIDRDRSAYEDSCERRSNAARIAAQARWNANDANRIKRNAIDAIICDSCQEKEEKNNKDKEKEKKDKNKQVYFPDSFSDEMKSAVEKWLAYKRERRDAYKPQGLQALYSQIENKLKVYAESDVIALIDECMANGWKGIIWDRLDRKPQKMQSSATYDLGEWESMMNNYVPTR